MRYRKNKARGFTGLKLNRQPSYEDAHWNR